MARDDLLQSKFFSSFSSEDELHQALALEDRAIAALIQQKLYPEFDEEAIYYSGRHNNPNDLRQFLQGSQYQKLQNQFDLVIKKLKTWGNAHGITYSESLDSFSVKLKNPTDRITILYAEGKKALEIVAVLLEESTIDLDLRKTLFTDLLADNELSKCIDGCYTRMANIAKRLQENRGSAHQINQWIRSYTTDSAIKVAASRPFAMPESYQRLICRTLDISVEANEVHASNYLLSQAKEAGMPVEIISDTGALEIYHKIKIQNKQQVVNLYLQQLEKEISATGLVKFIARGLHSQFNKIIADSTLDYMEKVDAIENRLKKLGLDSRFYLNEIFDSESLSLKPASSLMITLERRLTDKNWFNPIEKKTITVFSEVFSYYNFPGHIELSWLSKEGEANRYRFIDLIKTNDIDLNTETKFELLKKLLALPDFINKANDLNSLLNYRHQLLAMGLFVPNTQIASLLSGTEDPHLFVNVINKLPDDQGSAVIHSLPKSSISQLLIRGYLLADVHTRVTNIPVDYWDNFYNLAAQEDALRVTRNFIQGLIEKKFYDFSKLDFFYLKQVEYIKNIDFSNCNLKDSFFFQPVIDCKFDTSLLDNTIFLKKLASVSFINTDLRNTIFLGYNTYSDINFKHAKLSSRSFQELLDGGVTDFSYSHLREVNFREILGSQALKLDLSFCDLEGVDLEDLYLQNIKFYGSNLKKANLLKSAFNEDYFDKNIQIEGAELGIYTLYDLHNAGIKCFDNCKIIQDIDVFLDIKLQFKEASFKDTLFIGYFRSITMLACDFTNSKFISNNPSSEYVLLSDIDFTKSKFVNTEFHKLKFLSGVTFAECFLDGIILDDVKLPASILFKFYRLGHRNFKGVKELKGKMPEKLPPFPLSEASLSKEAFIHLYRQGVRDFRASNLYSFYLSEILTSQAISDIDLKLEGATYKQSLLGCSGSQFKRSVEMGISSRCTIHFLVQQSGMDKKFISVEDVRSLVEVTPKNRVVIKEVTLDHKPLYLLNNPDEINFYWGCPPEDEALRKAIDFTQQSTKPKERATSYIRFYVTKKFAEDNAIKHFVKELNHIGFQQGQVNYYTFQGELAAFDLEAKPIAVSQYPNLNTKFSSILASSHRPTSTLNEKKDRSRLYRIGLDLQRRAKSGLRAGVRQGAQYELGFALMHIIGAWITHPEVPEPKLLDRNEKQELKNYARKIVIEESDKKLASPYIRDLTWRVVVQCIERGECSNYQLVKEDIIDTLNTARPDIQVGNEVMWEKTKDLFMDVGAYLSEKFEKIKAVFFSAPSSSVGKPLGREWLPKPLFPLSLLSKQTTSLPPRRAIRSTSENFIFYWGENIRISKRKLHNWYDHPLLIHLIKNIELLFDELGYDLSRDTNFSEAKLAGFLYNLWMGLVRCGISNRSEPENILSLFKQPSFIESVLMGTVTNNTESCFNRTNANVLFLSSEGLNSTEKIALDRKKRLVETDEEYKQVSLNVTNTASQVKQKKSKSNFFVQKNTAKQVFKMSENQPYLNESYHQGYVLFKKVEAARGNDFSDRHALLQGVKRSHGNYHQQDTQLGISRVTTPSDIPSTLFALNVLVRGVMKKKYQTPLHDRRKPSFRTVVQGEKPRFYP